MKTTKKVLSVLLAVLMIMSSMSVCFGTISFAAATGVSDAQWNTLAEALNNDTVKNATFSGAANDYTVDDPDGKILAAVEAYYAVFNALADRSPSGSSAGNRTINQINSSIKSQMSSRGVSADAFLTGMLAGADVTATGTQQSSAETTSSTGTAPGANYSVPGSIKLTVMMESAITGYSIDELPASVVTSKSFTVTHKNDKYDYTYTTRDQTSGSGCNQTTTTYYTHKYTYYSYITAAVSAVNGPSVDTQTIINSGKTLAKYADYFSMDMDALYATDAATLTTVSTDVAAAKKAVVDGFGAGVFTHFFSAYAVDTLVNDIATAKEVQVLAPKLLKAYEDMGKGYADIITDRAALVTLATTMQVAIDAYNAASAAARAYCTTKGFIVADVTTFRNAVLREIELIDLRALIEEIVVTIAPYYNYDVDGVADGSVTSAMIGTAINKVASFISQLGAFKAADILDIAGLDLGEKLTSLKNDLNYLASVANYEDRFSAEYAEYAKSLFFGAESYDDIGALLEELKKYDSWYTGLKSLINEMKSVLGEEVANKLFDDLNNVMVSRMDDAYVALNNLLEGQIDYAYDLFRTFVDGGNEVITMANVSFYNKMKSSIGLINVDVYNYLKGETAHFKLSQEAINKYNEMQRDFPQYQEFLNTHGFSSFVQTTMDDLQRPDTEKDIARENENGIYKTSDADIEKIIGLLDAVLQNDQVKSLLGDLINKDKETGEPTGEPFDLAALLNGLIEGIYSDSLINTIVQYVYPIVCKEFAKVWAGIDTKIDMTVEDVEVLGSKKDVPVTADLSLYTVEDAIAAVGVYLAPSTLAANIQKNYSKYTDVINVLNKATTKAVYNKADDTFTNPWEDPALFRNVYDEETGEQLFNDDGTPKTEYNLNWGIDEATDKRAAFIDAACAALSGIEPLLLGILTNKTKANANESDSIPRGHKIGTGYGSAQVKIVINFTLELTIDPITLVLSFGGNDGWDNALAPIFEALGIPASEIPHGESMNSTRDILTNLFNMLDKVIAKVAEAPVTFILDALPNLAFALEGGLIKPLLGMLKTEINYYADAYYSVNAYLTTVTGSLDKAMKSDEPILINLGDMINLDDMGLDIGSFQAIWNMIAGGVELLKGIDAPNAGFIATLGELVPQKTNRSDRTYTATTVNGKTLGSNEAWHIKANKADVLLYLIEWALGSGLLGKFELPTEGFVADLIASLTENSDILLAAVVELLNQKEYDTLREYDWFEGLINGESVVGNSAYEIYLNPNNDWTKDKAEYLYKNLDALVAAILTMANVDFDEEAEGVQNDLGELIGGLIDGLLTDKTLTALAGLLAKLDLNALLAPKAEEETEGEDAPETVAEGEEAEEEAAALDIDVNALVAEFLGIDLAAVAAKYADIAAALEADPEYVADFGVTDAASFVAALVEMLEPLSAVLDFILSGENLVITIEDKTVELVGYDSYNNAIIPILEALGCNVVANPENALEATLTALIGKIESITTSETPIKAIIDILPGVFYFITSKGLSVSVRNLLQPVYVILDTIRPIFDLDLNETINGLLPEDFGIMLNIDDIGLDFIFDLLAKLVPDLDLSALKDVIYDICYNVATEYDSASTLQTEWKKGAYSESFSQGDLLTVVLSFVLEWATIDDNAKALDEMLGTDGLIASIGTVFESVEIAYGTPNWYYWFEDEAAFDDYIAGDANIPNTLATIDWENIGDNDWDKETAQYFANNIGALVDIIIGMINKDKTDDEGNALPTTLAGLVDGLVNGLVNEETLNGLVAMIADLIKDVDDNLLATAGYLLDVDIVGLKNYTCEAEISSISGFINELANVLDTYAGGLINWLFFGDDFRFAKKSDSTDTIVINGGLGYEKGLAMILEALGCKLPEEANTMSVLGALATRVDEILANPVNEVLDLLPNLIYFLNANGAGVAVNNLLQPVYALLDKLAVFGLEISIADLLKFTLEDGTEIAIDLANLSLANVVEIVETATGLSLDAAEAILVNFCTGKITKGTYIYKMEAAREDVITILLVVALELISDEAFAADLEEMLGKEGIVAAIKDIINGSTITYVDPDWNYMNGIETDDGVIEYVNQIVAYPNDWTEGKAEYLAENLPAIVDSVIAMLEINGVKYESLAALLNENVNIFTTETLNSLLDIIKGLLKDIDVELLKVGCLIDVKIDDLMAYEAPEGITTVDAFAAELANVLTTYAKGAVEWLLLGRDFKLLVKDADGIEEGLVAEGSYITINGAHGYAEGLALLLEALGCEELPDVYANEDLTTEKIVAGVLGSLAARIDEIFANPVDEVIELLPNLIYFLDADGIEAVIKNTTAAIMALVAKLGAFGIELDINSLVDLPGLMGIADKYEEGDDVIALDNLTFRALLKAVGLMTGLDLAELEDVLVPFAIGEVVKYDSVSASDAYKMVIKSDLDKHDMITVIFTAALRLVVENEDNAAKLDEMLNTNGIVAAIKDVFADVDIEYTAPEWNYPLADNGTVDAMKYSIEYPTNWTEDTAKYVTNVLLSPEFSALVAGLIDSDYNSLSDVLTDKVNVFTTDNLQAIVDIIANLLKDIDDTLLDAAGVLLGVNVVGLKAYKAPEGITTVDAFAAELANVLNTYAKGVVEWLLLGEDYTFFVKSVENGEPVDFITINGAYGYANGLALLLEALGCTDLPSEGTTEEIVAGVLGSLAARINAIFADPVVEVVGLLPNLLYFLNTNGVAAVIDNTIAAVTALLTKLEAFGIKLDINELVNLKAIMGLEETDAAISLDNLSMAAVLEAVGLMVGLDLTLIEDVLVGFALGKVEAYESVSDAEVVGVAKAMAYDDEFAVYDLVTVLANLVLITLVEENNAEFVKGIVGDNVYRVILNLFNFEEVAVQEFNWMATDKADTGYVFSAISASEIYAGHVYGPTFTEEKAQFIADNFGEFVDNIVYLLGIEVNGETVNNFKDLINGLLNGSVYNSTNVVAIRDALAGILGGIADLKVGGVTVGGYIVEVLKTAGIARLDEVANVEVPEFSENRAQFVKYLCEVLAPLDGVLAYVLADQDITFFVNAEGDAAAVSLMGAEGYAYGIIPLLEVLGCDNILTQDEYYAAVEADSSALLTSILNPLLDRVDEILADDPAQEILDMLPNLIYFINSNGVDTVVKNTLNAVYALLNAIEPIAQIDLYEIIGIDLAEIDFEWLFAKALELIADATGYEFEALDANAILELTVGKLESYESKNGKTAYRMVYAPADEMTGGKAEMVTVVMRLIVTFIMHENNQEMLLGLLRDTFNMSADVELYVGAILSAIGKSSVETQLGMDSALSILYYVFYGADYGADNAANGMKDLNAEWTQLLKDMQNSKDEGEAIAGDIIAGILDLDIFDDIIDPEVGIAPNGFIKFIMKIIEWFKALFSWGK